MTTPSTKVAIVTDSAAALDSTQLAQHGIFVAQMEITVDGQTYVDGPEGELSDFYSKLTTSSDTPTTSAPKPAEYLEQIRAAAEDADSVICISLSARLSAAHDAAKVGAELFANEQPDKTVRVFDSSAAASSQALIVLAAARRAASDGSLDEVETAARSVAEKVRLVAMLDTLRYVHRSGRVPKIAFWATSALNIKPVMEYSIGRIGAIGRPRSTGKAIKRIQQEMATDLEGKVAHINVMHADSYRHAAELEKWASESFDCAELFVTQFHPFMGAHTGPGLVGASWWAE
jgi:DegV family protein with EDD domain